MKEAMMNPRGMTIATVCMIAGLALLSSAAPGLARGLCNIDSVGTPPERKIVAAAATLLYTGGKDILDSLAAFENENRDAGQKAASAANESFKRAADSYKKLSESLKIDLRRITEIEPGVILTASLAARTDVFEQLLSKGRQPDASQQLMAECGQAAARIASATLQFQKDMSENPNREAPYTRLLAEWGRLIYMGRIVSVMFELGGGQR
jgi:hypothetical protein